MIPESALNNDETKKEMDKIKEIEKTVEREKLTYKTKNIYIYSFENFPTMKTFGRDSYEGKITLEYKLMKINQIYWMKL